MGVLPFLYTAALQEQGGAAVAGAAAVPCMVWPPRSDRDGRAGVHRGHTGEASLTFKTQLMVPNRRLVIATGPMAGTYNIVTATAQPMVPHVQLELLSRGA